MDEISENEILARMLCELSGELGASSDAIACRRGAAAVRRVEELERKVAELEECNSNLARMIGDAWPHKHLKFQDLRLRAQP